MPSIILQVINLFKAKENDLSLSLVAQHLGTGNTYLINYPIAKSMEGKGEGLILPINCCTSVHNQEPT